MKKRLLVLLLSVCLTAQSLPVSAAQITAEPQQENLLEETTETADEGEAAKKDTEESDTAGDPESAENESEEEEPGVPEEESELPKESEEEDGTTDPETPETEAETDLEEESGMIAEAFVSLEGVLQNGDLEPVEAECPEEPEAEIQMARASVKIETYLYRQLKKRAYSIDVEEYGLGIDDISKALAVTVNSNPDLYYVDTSRFNYYYYQDTGVVTSIMLDYANTDDKAFDRAVNEALAEVTPQMTDLEKIVVLHDYLVLHTEYDFEGYTSGNLSEESFSAYGVFVKKKAVCSGYMLAYHYLLKKCGITDYYVTSTSMNHAWNVVKLGKNYYHVDTTWDDVVPDVQGATSHQFLLVSDQELEEPETEGTPKHYGWSVYNAGYTKKISAVGKDCQYESAFWRGILSPVIANNGAFIYRKGSDMMERSALPDGEEHVLFSLPMEGELADDGDSLAGIASVYNNRLYYVTDKKVASCTLDGRDQRVHYSQDQIIWGFFFADGTAKVTYYNGSEQVTTPITLKNMDQIDLTGAHVRHLLLDQKTVSVGVGKTAALKLTILPDTLASTAVQWKSSDETVAVVDSKGTITGKAAGDCIVTAEADGRKVFCIVSVLDLNLKAPVFSNASSTADLNEQLILTAQDGTTIYYTTNGKTPTKSSTKYTKPIVIDKDMTVKAYAVRSGFYDSDVAEYSYKVCTNELKFAEDALNLTVHDAWQIEMKALPTTRTMDDVTFVSSDPEKLSVNGSVLTAQKEGTVTLKAQVTDHKGRPVTAECQVLIAPKTYTVTFVGFHGKVIETRQVPEDTDADLPEAPVPEGYRLIGWEGDCTHVEQDLTIRAIYEPITYQITYEGNGSKVPTDAVTAYTVESGTVRLPDPAERTDGYRFVGWFDNPSYVGTKVMQLTQGSTGDRHYYAKWISVRGLWIGKKGLGPDQAIPDKPISDKTYTGAKIIPDDYVVYDGETELVQGRDYTVTVTNNVKVNLMETEQELKKSPTVTIKGKGNYSGKVTVNFVIRPIQTGETPVSVKKVKIGTLGAYTYTGAPICPRPEVTGTDGKILTEGIDYNLSWSNNTQAGIASVLLTGINGYTGTRSVTFKILPVDLAAAGADGSAELAFISGTSVFAYEKGGARPAVRVTYQGTALQEGTDYTVKYLNNSNVAAQQGGKKPEVVITGKKNFKNKLSLTFTLEKKALSAVHMEAADVEENKKPGKYSSKLILTDTNGKNLTVADYDSKTLTYRDEAGRILGKQDRPEAGSVITVTAQGKGLYQGTVSTTYRICEAGKHMGKASITLRDSKAKRYYTGEALILDKEELKIRIGKTELTSDDFELIDYKNNVNKGTAQVTVRGVGDYAGTKVFKFKIVAQPLQWWK